LIFISRKIQDYFSTGLILEELLAAFNFPQIFYSDKLNYFLYENTYGIQVATAANSGHDSSIL